MSSPEAKLSMLVTLECVCSSERGEGEGRSGRTHIKMKWELPDQRGGMAVFPNVFFFMWKEGTK